MSTETLDPIDLQMQLYQQQSFVQIENAQSSYKEYQDQLKVVAEARDSYFFHKDTAEKGNLRMEEALLALEKGEIDAESLNQTN